MQVIRRSADAVDCGILRDIFLARHGNRLRAWSDTNGKRLNYL